MPSVAASAAISAILRAKLKLASAMSRSKCLAILCLSMTTDRERDLGGAAQRITFARDGGLDGGEVALGGGQQILALAAAFSGEIGVAADHQAFAGKVGGGDAGHVALVEQRELQRAALQQRLDRRGAQ